MAASARWFDLLSYFSGQQPFWRALLVSMLSWVTCYVIYALAVSSPAARASWAPSQFAMGIALPTFAATLWMLWHCASQLPPMALRLILRAAISAFAVGFSGIGIFLLLAGFVNFAVLLVVLSVFSSLAAWATLRVDRQALNHPTWRMR